MSEDKQAQVVPLVEPGVPADQGLSSLGLLMQLAGSVFAAYAALALGTLIVAMRGLGGQGMWLFIILGASVARSLAHRAAGTTLLYGTPALDVPRSPFAGIRSYIFIALGQTAGVTLLAISVLGLPGKLALGLAGALAAWPVALAVLIRLPRFRKYEAELPVSEDKGFEAAAILMTVLGTCGLLGTGAVLLLMLKAGSVMLQGAGVLLVATVGMLVIRSGLHVQAGLSGLRETSVDRAVERVHRYANFGMISAFCAAGALLLSSMMSGLNIIVLALVAGLCWMLMAWPAIIRRFFVERQFADLIAGDAAAVHRRAPDAGLSGLGWLLFGYAVLGGAMMIPQLVLGAELGDHMDLQLVPFMGTSLSSALWLGAGQVALQGWAGYELIRMGRHHKPVATAYGVLSVIIAVYVTWPMLDGLQRLGGLGPQGFLMFIPVALQLVIPVATLLLVHRNIAPTATARFRPRAPGAPPPR